MFYSYFESLCNQKGVSANQACKEMGVSRSVAAKWKSTKTSPRMDTLVKISDYFGVSIDELLSHSEKGNKKTATNESDGEVGENLKKLLDAASELTEQQAEFLLPQVLGLVSAQKVQDVSK